MLDSHTFYATLSRSPLDNDMWLPLDIQTTDLSRDEDLLIALQTRAEREAYRSISEDFVYVRLLLTTERLMDSTRSQLEGLGVECLEEGEPFEAYGIIGDTTARISALSRVGYVHSITIGEPPSSK